MNSDDPKRIAELEGRIQALEGLVRDLTRAVSASQPGVAEASRAADAVRQRWLQQGSEPKSAEVQPAPPPTPAVSRPARERPQPVPLPARDWEAIIGRYGTLVLATASALAAVGTFIGWAISKGWLGPPTRVVLGLMAAAGLAAAGLRLRKKERSFGSSLLGLSLAVVHVCMWGAGPALHLVPESVAFGFASLASTALALLARIEEDEPLWCVGFIGASIAPFVTSSGGGNMPLLAAYGASVLAASGRALGPRTWRVAGRLFGLAATLYVGTLMLGTERDYGPLLAMALPLAVGLTGVLPWMSGILRRDRLRPLGALAALAALRAGVAGSAEPGDWLRIALMIGAAGITWLALVDLTAVVAAPDEPASKPRTEGDWVDAGLVPVTFSMAILTAVPSGPRMWGLSLAASALVLLATVGRHRIGALRDASAAATALVTAASVALLAEGRPLLTAVGIAATGAACFAANLWRPSRSWEGVGSLALGWSMMAAIGLLSGRTPYFYAPFWTPESAACAAVLAAVFASWRMVGEEQPPKLLQGGTVVWAFAWIHQEIVFAFNPTAATLMRVLYYALNSVAAVWIGRAKGVAILRHVGLGLAVLAAGTALYNAQSLASIGARIAADLVSAGFLLAIAYWYRKPGASVQPIGTPEPEETPS